MADDNAPIEPVAAAHQPVATSSTQQLGGTASAHQLASQQDTVCASSNPTPEGGTIDSSLPTNVASNDDVDSFIPKKGRQKSKVWEHFTKIEVKEGNKTVVKAECHYCKKRLGGDSKAGTKHLHCHMDSCIQRKIAMRGQQVLLPKLVKGKQEVVVSTYNADTAKKELANAIIMHEYPLSIVDHIGFRRYSNALQPLFQVPSRNTIKKEIMKVYNDERSVALKLIDTNEGRVAITADLWTADNQKRGYMAITGHYIDSSWNLNNRILRFAYVPAPHTSDRLCDVLIDCIMDWNIDSKLSTITLDNCSTNDSMIDKIKEKLSPSTLLRSGSLLHMRCCAHILNLIVKDGIDVVKDGIEKIRDSVAFWMATPKRKEKFEDAAKQCRVSITKKLCLDCPTRWNSTFKMLEVALAYKDVFTRLRQREVLYTCFPSNSQWLFAKDVCDMLAIFNEITEVISGTKYPTSNLFFGYLAEIKLAISEWLTSPSEVIKKMAQKMFDKFDRYWSETHELLAIACVLDPRHKMELINFYYDEVYGDEAFEHKQRVRQLCYDLLYDYQVKMREELADSSPSHGVGEIGGDGGGGSRLQRHYGKYKEKMKRARPTFVKTELDHWFEEPTLEAGPEFDILSWWKVYGCPYPTLTLIAKDLLAIPITTVASESAFSVSGHTVSPHRSRLHWTTIEALMCARSWLWNTENIGNDTLHPNAFEDRASVLNEMNSDDEDEFVNDVAHRLILD